MSHWAKITLAAGLLALAPEIIALVVSAVIELLDRLGKWTQDA